MSEISLFSPVKLGGIELKNRIAMAPMTRCRNVDENAPGDLVAEYYGQRATAGIMITEGVSPSPNGTGYARQPGLWSPKQVAGWKKVAETVHAKGGRIFAQLMHTGRISHGANLPQGAEVVAPSAVKAAGQMWTDASGMQDFPTPRALSTAEVESTIEEFVTASKNAIAAGLDGIELHGANGYLIEQFLSPHTNQRTDAWGGSVAKRVHFVVTVAQRVAAAIGGDKVGIRLSPYGAASDMKPYPEIDETYELLAKELIATGIAYIHLVDHSSMGAPLVSPELKAAIRKIWPRTLILAGGFDRAKAEAALNAGLADIIAIGKNFISNPDLVHRLEKNLPLAPFDPATFYSADAKGYTDYAPLS